MLLFIAELLIGVPIELFVLFLVFRWVEKGDISVWQAFGIAAVPLVLGLLIARRHFRSQWRGTVTAVLDSSQSQQAIETSKTQYDGDGWRWATWYRLDTTACIRFKNNDDVQQVVEGARLTLYKRGWLGVREHIGASTVAFVSREDAARAPIFLSSSPIVVPPHTPSESFFFRFNTPLSFDVSSLDASHFTRIEFQVMGRPNVVIDMPVDDPPVSDNSALDGIVQQKIASRANSVFTSEPEDADGAVVTTRKDVQPQTVAVWCECNSNGAFLCVRNDATLATFYATFQVQGLAVGLSGSEFIRWTHTNAVKITIPRGVTFRAKLAELIWSGHMAMARWSLFGTTEHGIVDAHAHYSSCATSTPIVRAPNLVVSGQVIAEPDLPNGPIPYRMVLSAFGCDDQNQAASIADAGSASATISSTDQT